MRKLSRALRRMKRRDSLIGRDFPASLKQTTRGPGYGQVPPAAFRGRSTIGLRDGRASGRASMRELRVRSGVHAWSGWPSSCTRKWPLPNSGRYASDEQRVGHHRAPSRSQAAHQRFPRSWETLRRCERGLYPAFLIPERPGTNPRPQAQERRSQRLRGSASNSSCAFQRILHRKFNWCWLVAGRSH